jgi:hypothetical protein
LIAGIEQRDMASFGADRLNCPGEAGMHIVGV